MYTPKRFIKRSCFLALFVAFGLVPGCSIIEPRPVIQKDLDEINPRAIIQREKEAKPPGPPPFSEKLKPGPTGLDKTDKVYSLVFKKSSSVAGY